MIIKFKKTLYKDWISEWLKEKKDYVKESTYGNYSNHIYNHIIPKLGNYYLSDLTHKTIQNFLLELYRKPYNLSEKTIKDIINIVKNSLKKAINEEEINYIDLSFTYPKNTEGSKKIYVLTKYEQTKLTNYVLNNRTNRNVGILISLYTGIRIGELCALKWDDIDLKKGFIYISKTIQRVYTRNDIDVTSKVVTTSPKTKNANRDIPINKDFLEILKEFKGNKNHYILTNSEEYIEPRAYRKYFNKVLEENKINHFNFHSLRHTFATNCISLGIDYKTVSELLGHSNINTTLNLYVHPRLSEKKKCMNLICKVFQEKQN